MGIHDRDYYREDQRPSGFQLRPPTTAVMWLLLLNIAFYIANIFILENNAITTSMELPADVFIRPWKFYSLISYGFAHAPLGSGVGFMHIVGNMWGLFMFGRRLEEKYGRTEFLIFYLLAIVVSGLAWVGATVLQYRLFYAADAILPVVIGASGAISALIVLYCLLWPKQTFLLLGVVPVPAWGLGLFVIGMDLLSMLGIRDGNVAWQCHLGGAAFGALYFYLGFQFSNLIPAGLLSGRWFKSSPNLKIHDPDEPAMSEADYAALDEEGDRLVAKVAEFGEASLTAHERKKLEDYSRRMRQKHR